MKKCFSCFFAAVLAMMMIVSCGKDSKKKQVEAPVAPVEPSYTEDTSYDYSTSDSSSSSSSSSRDWGHYVEGVIMYSNVGLFEERPDDNTRLRWIGSLPKGCAVEVEVENTSDEKGTPGKCPMYINKDEKQTDMARIRLDNGTYYVSWSTVVGYAEPCVMVGTSKEGVYYGGAYSQQIKTKLSKWKIPGGTVGAVLHRPEVKDGWVEANFWVEPNADYPKGLLITEMFYPEGQVRTDKSSVETAMLATRIRALKDVEGDLFSTANSLANDICDDSLILDLCGLGSK